MKTKVILFTAILQIIFSCSGKKVGTENRENTSEDKVSQDSSLLTKNKQIQEEAKSIPNQDKPALKESKPMSKRYFASQISYGTFFKNEDFEDLVDYKLLLDLENLTNYKITSIEIIPEIDILFKDKSFKAGLHSDDEKAHTYFEDLSWLPNEVKTFELYFSGNQGGGTSPDDFERTPKFAELNIKIVAESISVDDERKFEMNLKTSLLDDWKRYQTKLGLRKQ